MMRHKKTTMMSFIIVGEWIKISFRGKLFNFVHESFSTWLKNHSIANLSTLNHYVDLVQKSNSVCACVCACVIRKGNFEFHSQNSCEHSSGFSPIGWVTWCNIARLAPRNACLSPACDRVLVHDVLLTDTILVFSRIAHNSQTVYKYSERTVKFLQFYFVFHSENTEILWAALVQSDF